MKKLFYIAASLLVLVASAAIAETRSPKHDISTNLTLFNAVVKELQSNYVDTIDINHAVETAIDAMLDELDPYTVYMPRKEQEEFRAMNTGEYGGIGSYIMARGGNVYISGPHRGSPAARAGLRPGDLILEIDSASALGLTTEQVSSRLKGPKGTTVRVKLKRPYVTDSIITVEMVRDKIQIPAVTYSGEVRPGIGYIGLQQFSEKSADEVLEALDTLINKNHIQGLILDLRENGGGYLECAVKILGYFLPKGTEVLRTRGKGVLEEKVYKTPSKPIAPKLPLVVLTDGGTASASEITSGALQDLDRAVIMGQRSFGKGLVQTTRELPYDGLLKVTVAKYYIPSGRLIQAIDYSHRNPDGSVARTPDSLTTEYRTAAGRIVRDGGGITPDIRVDYPEISRLTYNVVRDNWAFDFANRYAATHASIPPAEQFEITDSIYAEFKKSIDPAKFNYDKVCENILKNLREAAKIEGYASDTLSAEIDRLETMLKHPLDRDLDTHRSAITPYLEREIANRYYYREGETQSWLRHDIMVDSAATLLRDPARYQKILRR